jgi:hypothetical protein
MSAPETCWPYSPYSDPNEPLKNIVQAFACGLLLVLALIKTNFPPRWLVFYSIVTTTLPMALRSASMVMASPPRSSGKVAET